MFVTQVNTSKGTFRCRRVIVTAGAWINQVLCSVDVHVPVTVTQEQVTYMATPNVKLFTKPEYVADVTNYVTHNDVILHDNYLLIRFLSTWIVVLAPDLHFLFETKLILKAICGSIKKL